MVGCLSSLCKTLGSIPHHISKKLPTPIVREVSGPFPIYLPSSSPEGFLPHSLTGLWWELQRATFLERMISAITGHCIFQRTEHIYNLSFSPGSVSYGKAQGWFVLQFSPDQPLLPLSGATRNNCLVVRRTKGLAFECETMS